MSWQILHRRGEILRTVIATADSRRDGVLPMDVEGVAETFGDELTLLGALQLKWHTRLAGRIEAALAAEPVDLPGAVEAAWAATYDELPGVRAVIDQYRAVPLDHDMATAMDHATANEHALMAVMAGRANHADAGASRIGAVLEARARARRTRSGDSAAVTVAAPRTSLLDRLRAALAA